MFRTLLLGIVSIMLLSCGQASFKVGLNAIGGFSLGDGMGGLSKIAQTPWIVVGFACYGLSSVLWLDVLSKLPYTLAFPLVGLTYMFTLLIGRLVFHEPVGWMKILGVVFILSGIFLIVRTAVQASAAS